MKKRVRIDTAFLSFAIILTGFLYFNGDLYLTNRILDNVLDFFGMIVILGGVLLRMIARGYKKAHSRQGGALVTGGPYVLVRNPMYLGSFLMGAGFILIAWPWWSLPFFALFFYARFIRQIRKEEQYLSKHFPEDFAAYCKKAPRIFPSLKSIRNFKFKKVFSIQEAFSTKEKYGLGAWPLLVIVLEVLQETVVFHGTDFMTIVEIFSAAAVVFIAGAWVAYHYG